MPEAVSQSHIYHIYAAHTLMRLSPLIISLPQCRKKLLFFHISPPKNEEPPKNLKFATGTVKHSFHLCLTMPQSAHYNYTIQGNIPKKYKSIKQNIYKFCHLRLIGTARHCLEECPCFSEENPSNDWTRCKDLCIVKLR